jgi:hypothetical protein
LRGNSSEKTKPVREYTTYCIEIKEWSVPYSLHLNEHKKFRDGPCWEYVELKIQGNFIYPGKFAGKNVESRFLSDRLKTKMLYKPDKYDDYKPLCVGSLTLRGERREYLGYLPMDTFPMIIGTLAADKYKYWVFHGYKPMYGSAEIFSVHFDEEFDEEEW